MKAIVAVDRNWGIGRKNDLLVRLPGDLKYYKDRTIGRCVVFGQKTLESLPGGRPLPKRDHIILSDDPDFAVEPREGFACDICRSPGEVIERAAAYEAAGREVMVCGGASVYELFFDECDVFYVTVIDHVFEADRFFPDLDKKGFKVTWESGPREEMGYSYRFRRYERE